MTTNNNGTLWPFGLWHRKTQVRFRCMSIDRNFLIFYFGVALSYRCHNLLHQHLRLSTNFVSCCRPLQDPSLRLSNDNTPDTANREFFSNRICAVLSTLHQPGATWEEVWIQVVSSRLLQVLIYGRERAQKIICQIRVVIIDHQPR